MESPAIQKWSACEELVTPILSQEKLYLEAQFAFQITKYA